MSAWNNESCRTPVGNDVKGIYTRLFMLLNPTRQHAILIMFVALFAFAQLGFAMDRVPVFVSIAPQKYFVKQIGKEDLWDKIATEEDADSPDALVEHLAKVGHPALAMDALF